MGISNLANNGGKIRIVASPKLSDADIEAIRKGYEMRDTILRNTVLRELNPPQTKFEEECLNQLANLIAGNILDIKIAFIEQNNNISMYHEKMGLIADSEGNTVAFSGSMNESLTALSLNYESIDVFCSWKSIEQRERVEEKRSAFSSIWNNNEPSIIVLEFPELSEQIIRKYRSKIVNYYENINEDIDELNVTIEQKKIGPIIPPNIILHNYQIEAIDEWEKCNYRGIFDMATGTGKTFTSIGALARLCNALNNNLAAIIICPYQHLVEQWVEDLKIFNINPIIGYSSSSQKNWLKLLKTAISDQKLHVKNKDFFCFITTNATFSSNKIQNLIKNIESSILLIIDEAHNFGSERLSKLLTDKYTYRLALSATIERHNDDEGTQKIYNFFGKKCIQYTLETAINENKLTPYKYFPIITTLQEEERNIYSQLSFEIRKCIILDKFGKPKLSEKGKILAIKRARIIAGAKNKIFKLKDLLSLYKNNKHILVYCGATTILPDNKDYSEIDEEDIRQIDSVTDMIGNQLNMTVAQFTSRENIQKRERLKKEFSEGKTLQILVAIKCLDEGFNIPNIRTAFILASTTNPKEYIQRRGRVLRLAPGKEFAEIYDFITLPHDPEEVHSLTVEQRKQDLSLVKNEISRAEEFSRLAINMAQANKAISYIKEAYSINEYLLNYKEDYTNA